MNIHETAIIHPGVRLAEDVTVGPYTVIEEGVTIGRGTKIGPHVVIKPFVEMGEDNEIYQFASIGEIPQDLKFGGEETRLVIGDRNRIREFVTLNRGTKGGGGITKIGDDNLIMAYSHVAHDCQLGSRIVLANGVQMGGHVLIDDDVIIGGLAALHQFTLVGRQSMIGGGSVVVKDVPPYTTIAGNRAQLHGLNLIGLKRRGHSAKTISELKKAYATLFKSGLTIKEAREKITAGPAVSEDVMYLVDFVDKSKRGVCR